MRRLTEPRTNLRPAEYPEFLAYRDAIRHSYWLHTEYNLTDDVHDFRTRATPVERSAIRNTLLAIAQVEVAVKTFWGDLMRRYPKPEIGAVGYTFAESEVRHQDAYAHLLEVLGLNGEFDARPQFPAFCSGCCSSTRISSPCRRVNWSPSRWGARPRCVCCCSAPSSST